VVIIEGLIIIGAPVVGLVSAIAGQEMNRSLPHGFADLNRFHLLWLWFAVFFYVSGLIGPTIKLFKHDLGLGDWLVGLALGVPLAGIGILMFLVPGYYGLALLSGHKGRNYQPIIRNFLGVAILLSPVVVFALLSLLAANDK
jgi:hypothetical protein